MARIKHGTSSNSSVTTVTLDAQYSRVEVMNRDTSAANEIFFTTDGTTPSTDTDDVYCVPASSGLEVPVQTQGTTVVKLKAAAGTPKYSVTGVEGTAIVRTSH